MPDKIKYITLRENVKNRFFITKKFLSQDIYEKGGSLTQVIKGSDDIAHAMNKLFQ